MTVDIDELEALARAATPGPWEERHLGYGHHHDVIRPPDGSPDDGGDIVALSWEQRDAAYIAAADPAVVLEMVQRLRAAEDDGPGYHAEVQMGIADSETLDSWATDQAVRQRLGLLEAIVRDLAARPPSPLRPCPLCCMHPLVHIDTAMLTHDSSCPYRRAVEATSHSGSRR